MTNKQAREILEKHLDGLKEFFPTVQILVSWSSEDGMITSKGFYGTQDWKSRLTLIQDFLISEHEMEPVWPMPKASETIKNQPSRN